MDTSFLLVLRYLLSSCCAILGSVPGSGEAVTWDPLSLCSHAQAAKMDIKLVKIQTNSNYKLYRRCWWTHNRKPTGVHGGWGCEE